MIQYAKDEHRTALMHLWKRCFSDTDEFICLYFNRIYKEEETLVLIEDNTPVASLQMVPYSLQIGNEIQPSGYISGAMTHPNHRRKGYMERLLLAAFEEMKKKGYTSTFLIPQENWLFGFYEKYGYEKAFPVSFPVTYNYEITSNQDFFSGITVYSSLKEMNIDSIYAVYATLLSQKENVVLKTKTQFLAILEDRFLDNGVVFVTEQGIAFSGTDEKTVRVKECLSQNEDIQHQLLLRIALYYAKKEVVVFNTGTTSFSHFSGMIRTLGTSEKTPPNNIYMSMMLD